jgi:DsbC/DsbD-like thiol-disulfide interchange protein
MPLGRLHDRTSLFVCLAIFTGLAVFAATAGAAEDPVAWSGKVLPQKPLAPGARFTVELDARIQPGWHLYALDQPEGGPIATEITLPEDQQFSFAGSISAPKPHVVFDPNFNLRVGFYLEKAQFRIPLEVGSAAGTGTKALNIQTRYQCCNDKLCLPPKRTMVSLSVEMRP